MPNLDQLLAAVVSAAFGIRAVDGRRTALARVGYALVAYDLAKNAFRPEGGGDLLDGVGGQGGQNTGLAKSTSRTTPLKFEERKARTIAERVKYVHEQMMKGVRDPVVYSLAREVVSRKCGADFCIKPKDHWGEAVALFNDVKSRVRYTWDPLWYDAFQTPNKTLKLRAGDCDDVAALLGAMLISIGLNVRSRIVQTTGEPTWNHIYLMVNIPELKTWRPLDLTVKQPAGWEVPKSMIVRYKDFDVLEKELPRLQALTRV